MNRLSIEERAKILSCLVEGNSIRATCRMTGAAKGTVIKLLAEVGEQQAPLNLDELGEPRLKQPSGVAFAESIRMAIRTFRNEEFTRANVETVLKSMGVQLPAKNPGARIAGELTNLVERGMLTRTHKGKGSAPHKFRLLARLENDAEVEKSEGSARTLPSRLTVQLT